MSDSDKSWRVTFAERYDLNMTTTRDADAARLQRQEVVEELLIAHWPMRRIAERVGVSVGTVHSDVQAIKARWKAHHAEAYDAFVAGELQKCNALERALWPRAMAGDDGAVDRVLRTMHHRARLLGLYAPTRETVNVITEDAVDAEIRRLTENLARHDPGAG